MTELCKNCKNKVDHSIDRLVDSGLVILSKSRLKELEQCQSDYINESLDRDGY